MGVAALPVLSEEPASASKLGLYDTVVDQADELADSADSSHLPDASDAVTEFLRGHKKKDRKASKDSRHSSRRSSKKSSKKISKSKCKKSCKKKTSNVNCSRRCSNDWDEDSEDSEDVSFLTVE